jgi:hypothetical protein
VRVQKSREKSLSRYINELEEKGLSLLVYRDGEFVYSGSGRGVGPLLNALETIGKEKLQGSLVVDKIIGRAAAFLIVYMEAAEAHAVTLSATGKDVLQKYGLKYQFRHEVPVVRGRDGAPLCPFERLVQDVNNAEEAYEKIKAKMAEY